MSFLPLDGYEPVTDFYDTPAPQTTGAGTDFKPPAVLTNPVKNITAAESGQQRLIMANPFYRFPDDPTTNGGIYRASDGSGFGSFEQFLAEGGKADFSNVDSIPGTRAAFLARYEATQAGGGGTQVGGGGGGAAQPAGGIGGLFQLALTPGPMGLPWGAWALGAYLLMKK